MINTLILLAVLAAFIVVSLLVYTFLVFAKVIQVKVISERYLIRQNGELEDKLHFVILERDRLKGENTHLHAHVLFNNKDVKVMGNVKNIGLVRIPFMENLATHRLRAFGPETRITMETLNAKDHFVEVNYIDGRYSDAIIKEQVSRVLAEWMVESNFVFGQFDRYSDRTIFSFRYFDSKH